VKPWLDRTIARCIAIGRWLDRRSPDDEKRAIAVLSETLARSRDRAMYCHRPMARSAIAHD